MNKNQMKKTSTKLDGSSKETNERRKKWEDTFLLCK